MLDVRNMDGTKLYQEDWNHIDEGIMEIAAGKKLEAKKKGEKTFKYRVLGGINRGACWFACVNVETANLFRKYCPEMIAPPLEEGPDKGKDRSHVQYVVYGADERPYRHMKAMVPIRYARKAPDHLTWLIICSNDILEEKYKGEDGIEKEYHFKVTKGMGGEELEENPKFFIVELEVDEKLFKPLVGMKGKLKLGCSFINLQGGGMVRAAKKKIREVLDGVTDNDVIG